MNALRPGYGNCCPDTVNERLKAPAEDLPPSEPRPSFLGQWLKFASTDPLGETWRVYRFERDIMLAVKAIVPRIPSNRNAVAMFTAV